MFWSGRPLSHYLCTILVLAGLSIAYAQTLAPGLTWANNGADGGDLITAAALLAAMCVYAIVRELSDDRTWHGAAAAALAAFGLGVSPVFWSQALIAEVYSLNAFFLALTLLFLLRSIRRSDTDALWPDRLAALVIGL